MPNYLLCEMHFFWKTIKASRSTEKCCVPFPIPDFSCYHCGFSGFFSTKIYWLIGLKIDRMTLFHFHAPVRFTFSSSSRRNHGYTQQTTKGSFLGNLMPNWFNIFFSFSLSFLQFEGHTRTSIVWNHENQSDLRHWPFVDVVLNDQSWRLTKNSFLTARMFSIWKCN